MKYRKLRIAWSVAWGVVFLLLVAFWVRSYSHWDHWVGTPTGKDSLVFVSARGIICCGYSEESGTPVKWFWSTYANPERRGQMILADGPYGRVGILLKLGPLGIGISDEFVFLPHWFPAVLLLTLTTAPWIPWLRWRFSLRTLLIGMTVAAIGLGWLVYVLRK